MNNHIMKIQNVMNKFRLDLEWVNCIETSAFIKFNMRTHGMIKDILKYENEFESAISDKIILESKNGYISICIPKDEIDIYPIKEILESDFYNNYPGPLKIALGENIDGAMVIGDLEKWINVLIAGVPGSGKSNLLNVIINSFIEQSPDQIRLVLFDLKEVELIQYNHIPHLLKPVISSINNVQSELLWLISEMNRRYQVLEKSGCRNIQKYNSKNNTLPYLVVIIDELANIILEKKECEKQIVLLASKGRACGIHLVIATQKPNVDIVTPLIKSNIDTRISFHVASHYDSLTILDRVGAEKLGKHGDMLLRDEDGLERIQCCFISDEEIDNNIRQYKNWEVEIIEERPQLDYIEADYIEIDPYNESDELYNQTLQFIKDTGKCNQWALKRHLRKGDKVVSIIIERLIKDGYISNRKIGHNYEILRSDF